MVSEAPWLIILFLWLPEAASALNCVQIHFTVQGKVRWHSTSPGERKGPDNKNRSNLYSPAFFSLQSKCLFANFQPTLHESNVGWQFLAWLRWLFSSSNEVISLTKPQFKCGKSNEGLRCELWQLCNEGKFEPQKQQVAGHEDMEVKRKKGANKVPTCQKNTWMKSHVNKSVFSSSNLGGKKQPRQLRVAPLKKWICVSRLFRNFRWICSTVGCPTANPPALAGARGRDHTGGDSLFCSRIGDSWGGIVLDDDHLHPHPSSWLWWLCYCTPVPIVVPDSVCWHQLWFSCSNAYIKNTKQGI